MENEKGKTAMEYDDIIGMEHPVSKRHRPMPLEARAAQFAPFAALTGHQDAIDETARHTDAFADLEADALSSLDRKLDHLRQMSADGGATPSVTVTFFEADSRKSGGRYVTLQGSLKRIRDDEQLLELADGRRIEIRRIVDLMCEG